MSQIGSNRGMVSQNVSQGLDGQGLAIIASDNAFGVSPAGPALLSQQLFGIANATFELLPPNPNAAISAENPIPYWDFIEYSNGIMSATAVYDSTTKTWGVTLYPGSAVTDDYCELTTRSFVLTDDNLNLRQTALTVLSKSGTAGGTAAQWRAVLSATYFDHSGGTVSSYSIGTVTDVQSWTSLSGTTTAGGSAVGASARYVDLSIRITALGTVTGTANLTVKSALLSSSIGASQKSFLVTETITSSTTWSVPTSVTNLVAVVGVGAGGGGAGGGLAATRQVGQTRVAGGGGGGGAPYLIARDVPLGTATSVTIGIGAGGSGGTAQTFTKAAGSNANAATAGAAGSGGGATTFGSYFTITGGGGGTAGAVSNNGAACAAGGGGTAGSYSSDYSSATPGTPFTTATGGIGGSCTTATAPYFSEAGSAGGYGALALIYPYATSQSGISGGSASSSGTAFAVTIGAIGTALGSATFGGGGGGAASGAGTATVSAGGGAGGPGTPYRSAAGGAGASVVASLTGAGSGSAIATAGNGANAPDYGGGGGGAGGGICFTTTSSGNYDPRPALITSGRGGSGANAIIVLVYVG
jgi:hypothetical protein